MNGLEDEYQGRVAFQYVNIHNPKNQPLIDQYGFSTTPEFYLVDAEGKVIDGWGEGITAEEIREVFDQVLEAGG